MAWKEIAGNLKMPPWQKETKNYKPSISFGGASNFRKQKFGAFYCFKKETCWYFEIQNEKDIYVI